jgi:hypothetical protein
VRLVRWVMRRRVVFISRISDAVHTLGWCYVLFPARIDIRCGCDLIWRRVHAMYRAIWSDQLVHTRESPIRCELLRLISDNEAGLMDEPLRLGSHTQGRMSTPEAGDHLPAFEAAQALRQLV